MNRYLLIGFGPHARRIYFPIFQKWGKEHNAELVYAVDLVTQKHIIHQYLTESNQPNFPVLYLGKQEVAGYKISNTLQRKLDQIVQDFQINGIVISTEPLSHMMYARWALKKGLSVLMDKPISTHENIVNDTHAAEMISKDFNELVKLKNTAESINSKCIISLMAQRRYHPAFRAIKDAIREVTQFTGCPVTSVQSFHGDGQWRMPDEMVDITYHSYNQGYGKCSHSGYHSLDIVPWLVEGGETEGKKSNNVDIYTNFNYPLDFMTQIDHGSYARLFKNYNTTQKYQPKELETLIQNYGEIDAFNSLAFKKDDKALTFASVNLTHNSISQRGWLKAKDDLYKGNGRIRQESHTILQGPFQAIHYQSYQSKEVMTPETAHSDVGGEYHLDIHIFRNDSINNKWKSYKKFCIDNLDVKYMSGYSRGHQEDARRACVIEFMQYVDNKISKKDLISELTMHQKSTQILSGIYQSAVLRKQGKNPLINMKY